MEYHCLNRFRRRRLLAFLRRNNLAATFDALKHETRVFLDVRFLQRLVVDGRWQEAREYFSRFLPCRDEVDAHTALRFVTRLNVLDDLAQGKLGCIDAADDLQTQLDAFPSSMVEADPHYSAAVCTVLYNGSHPAYWDPVDWKLIRLKAAQVVKDLVTRAPKFRHLLRLPRCPSNPGYTIPFGFGGCRRHKRKKNIGRMSASLLARRFLQKERRPSSPCTQGLSCEPMDLEEIIDETLLAGKQEVKEHSDSCSEGIPTVPANAVTKRLSQECSAESANGAKLKPTTREFCPDVVNAVDADHVLNKGPGRHFKCHDHASEVHIHTWSRSQDVRGEINGAGEAVIRTAIRLPKCNDKRLYFFIGNLSTRHN